MMTTVPTFTQMTWPGTDRILQVPYNNDNMLVLYEEDLPLCKQELDLTYQEEPDFAPRVLQAIHEGRIFGGSFVYHMNEKAGCFYGQVKRLSFSDSEEFAIRQRRILKKRDWESTLIEHLIIDVEEGNLPDPVECPELYMLAQIVTLYLPKEEVAGEQ